jgi:hypothetical protein
MVQTGTMAVATLDERPAVSRQEAIGRLREGVKAMAALVRSSDGDTLGAALIQIREAGIDPLEAIFADGVRRFDRSGEFAAQGALSMAAWLKWKCRLSGGAASERVEIARQLNKLPQTEAAQPRPFVPAASQEPA